MQLVPGTTGYGDIPATLLPLCKHRAEEETLGDANQLGLL